jgi:hypothetical protein
LDRLDNYIYETVIRYLITFFIISKIGHFIL